MSTTERHIARTWRFASSWAFGLGTVVAVALGCGSMRSTVHPEVEAWAHRPSFAISVLYRQPLVAESRRQGEPYERGRPEIDVVGQRVFVGSSDRGLYALRAPDGAVLWRFETLGPVQSEPLYDPREDVLYFGSNDGALYKVRASDGKLIWRFSTNAEVGRRPVLADGTLYFVNANDTLLAVDPTSGKRRWSQHRAPAMGMAVAGHAGLTLHGGVVYVAFSDGVVTAYAADTGREVWEPVDLTAEAEQSSGEVPKYLDVDTTPEFVEISGVPAIVVGSYAGGVFALQADTGGQLWSNPGVLSVTDVARFQQRAHLDPETERVYAAHDLIIASTGTTGLWALDTATGAEVWRRDLPDGGTSAPAFIAGAMLISTTQQGLYLLSPTTGGLIDGIHTQVGFSMPPAVHGHRAFLLSDGGQFTAFSVPSPKPTRAPKTSFAH